MANKRAEILASVKQSLQTAGEGDTAVAERPKAPPVARPSSVIGRRTQAAEAIRHNNKVPTVQYRHPTARIRMWHGHNRDYELLDANSCADLIEGFQRAGGQQLPAIARKVSDSDDYDLEVICGARRHWTADFLGQDLLVEVRNISDREAFILQDLENRDRQDVSDLERAIDYKKALELYFDGEQAAMADYLKIDRGDFSRLLYLSELPHAIVTAYNDVRGLKVHHGVTYKKFLADANQRRLLLERAAKLKDKKLDGREVFSRLKKTITHSVKPNRISYGAASISTMTKNRLQISLDLNEDVSEQNLEKLSKDCVELIRRALSS